MNEIRTRVLVGPDHRITGTAPPGVPPGEHEASITVAIAAAVGKTFTINDFPVDHGPWDDRVSLRREDMYGDDGR